jgi:adenosylcobinamide-GDP ribazoletransferase
MRALAASFAFLTRIPVWRGPLRDQDLGRSVAFFPLVGMVLGLVVTGLCAVSRGVLSSTLLAIVAAAVLAGITGGLHLDGLADLFDGLGGGRGDRARTLEIMRDSRIGAHGTVALVLLLMAKVAALDQAIGTRDLAALLAFPCLARWAVTPLIVFFPYARPQGLGRAFSGEARLRDVLIATGLVLVVIAALGTRGIIPAVATLAAVWLLGAWLTRRLGGLTGDVYGAAIELGEVVALVLMH